MIVIHTDLANWWANRLKILKISLKEKLVINGSIPPELIGILQKHVHDSINIAKFSSFINYLAKIKFNHKYLKHDNKLIELKKSL